MAVGILKFEPKSARKRGLPASNIRQLPHSPPTLVNFRKNRAQNQACCASCSFFFFLGSFVPFRHRLEHVGATPTPRLMASLYLFYFIYILFYYFYKFYFYFYYFPLPVWVGVVCGVGRQFCCMCVCWVSPLGLGLGLGGHGVL